MTLLVHVLPDFEMLGPGDTAKVIGAGVAVFGLERDIIVEGNRETGQPDALVQGTPFARLVYEAWPISVARQDVRTFDWDTVAWWSRQDPAVRSVAFEAMAGKGRALRLAVKEMIDAVLTLVHPEGALPANHGPHVVADRVVGESGCGRPVAVDELAPRVSTGSVAAVQPRLRREHAAIYGESSDGRGHRRTSTRAARGSRARLRRTRHRRRMRPRTLRFTCCARQA